MRVEEQYQDMLQNEFDSVLEFKHSQYYLKSKKQEFQLRRIYWAGGALLIFLVVGLGMRPPHSIILPTLFNIGLILFGIFSIVQALLAHRLLHNRSSYDEVSQFSLLLDGEKISMNFLTGTVSVEYKCISKVRLIIPQNGFSEIAIISPAGGWRFEGMESVDVFSTCIRRYVPEKNFNIKVITMNTLVFDIETIPNIEGGRKHLQAFESAWEVGA